MKNTSKIGRYSVVFNKRMKAVASWVFLVTMLILVLESPLSLIASTRQAIFGDVAVSGASVASPPAIEVVVPPVVSSPPSIEVGTEPPAQTPTSPPSQTPPPTQPPVAPEPEVTTPPAIDVPTQDRDRIAYLEAAREDIIAQIALIDAQIAELTELIQNESNSAEFAAELLQNRIIYINDKISYLFNRQFELSQQAPALRAAGHDVDAELISIMQAISNYTELLSAVTLQLQGLQNGDITPYEVLTQALEELIAQRELLLERLAEIEQELLLLTGSCPILAEKLANLLRYAADYRSQISGLFHQVYETANRFFDLTNAQRDADNQDEYDYYANRISNLEQEINEIIYEVETLSLTVQEFIATQREAFAQFALGRTYGANSGVDTALATLQELEDALYELEELLETFLMVRDMNQVVTFLDPFDPSIPASIVPFAANLTEFTANSQATLITAVGANNRAVRLTADITIDTMIGITNNRTVHIFSCLETLAELGRTEPFSIVQTATTEALATSGSATAQNNQRMGTALTARHFSVATTAAAHRDSDLHLHNVVLTRPLGTTTRGGGVAVLGSGALHMYDGAVISNNRAYVGGGVILSGDGGTGRNSTLYMRGGLIDNNYSERWSAGAGGGGVLVESSSHMHMFGGTIRNNIARNSGGGIQLGGTGESGTARLYMTGGIVESNTAQRPAGQTAGGAGGGIHMNRDTIARISGNSTIRNNTAGGAGGGIRPYQADSILHLSGNVQIIGNESGASPAAAAREGGGIAFHSDLRLAARFTTSGWTAGGVTFPPFSGEISGNTAGTSGGGIHSGSVAITLNNVTMHNNVAGTTGGAIHLGHHATGSGNSLSISNSCISHNEADTNGGAIFSSHGRTMTFDNTVMYDNVAGGAGGAIHTLGAHTINLNNNTRIHGNSASGTGGGIHVGAGNGAIVNMNGLSAIYNNTTTGNAAHGGGIHFGANATVNMNSANSISGNTAGGAGGGIHFGGTGTVTATNANSHITFDNNTANNGNGGAINFTGTTTITANTAAGIHSFSNNTAQNNGGAIHAHTTGTINFNSARLTMDGNTARTGTGGAVNLAAGSTFQANNVAGVRSISGNTAGSHGGAINMGTAASRVDLNGTTTINDNTSTNGNGGAIHIAANLDANNAFSIQGAGSISGNTANNGGGVWANLNPTSGANSAGNRTARNNSNLPPNQNTLRLRIVPAIVFRGNYARAGLLVDENLEQRNRANFPTTGSVGASNNSQGWFGARPEGAHNVTATTFTPMWRDHLFNNWDINPRMHIPAHMISYEIAGPAAGYSGMSAEILEVPVKTVDFGNQGGLPQNPLQTGAGHAPANGIGRIAVSPAQPIPSGSWILSGADMDFEVDYQPWNSRIRRWYQTLNQTSPFNPDDRTIITTSRFPAVNTPLANHANDIDGADDSSLRMIRQRITANTHIEPFISFASHLITFRTAPATMPHNVENNLVPTHTLDNPSTNPASVVTRLLPESRAEADHPSDAIGASGDPVGAPPTPVSNVPTSSPASPAQFVTWRLNGEHVIDLPTDYAVRPLEYTPAQWQAVLDQRQAQMAQAIAEMYVTEPMTFYAHFRPVQHLVTFYINGGTLINGELNVAAEFAPRLIDDPLALTEVPNPEWLIPPHGHYFDGWWDLSDPENPRRWEFTSAHIVQRDLVLVARFAPIPHAVNFVSSNGGTLSTSGAPLNTTIPHGSAVTTARIPVPQPNSAYVFSHWESSTTPDVEFATACDCHLLAPLSVCDCADCATECEGNCLCDAVSHPGCIANYVIQGPTTFTAIFELDRHIVTFRVAPTPTNSALINNETYHEARIVFGQQVMLENIPALAPVTGDTPEIELNSGRVFLGWTQGSPLRNLNAYTDAELQAMSQGNLTSTRLISPDDIASTVVVYGEDLVFYANFWYSYHTVTFAPHLGDYGVHVPCADFPTGHPLVVYRRYGTPVTNFPSFTRPNYERQSIHMPLPAPPFSTVSSNSDWGICRSEVGVFLPAPGNNCTCENPDEHGDGRVPWDETLLFMNAPHFLVRGDITLHALWSPVNTMVVFRTDTGGHPFNPPVNQAIVMMPHGTAITSARIPDPHAQAMHGYRFSHWEYRRGDVVVGPFEHDACTCHVDNAAILCECEYDECGYCETDCTCYIPATTLCLPNFIISAEHETTYFYAVFVPALTDMKISKHLSGNIADIDNSVYTFNLFLYDYANGVRTPIAAGTEFDYTVSPTSESPYYETGTITVGTNGLAVFTLRHGQTIELHELIIGTHFRIVEQVNTAVYEVTIRYNRADGTTGEIDSNSTGYRVISPLLLGQGDETYEEYMHFTFYNVLNSPVPMGATVTTTNIAILFVVLGVALIAFEVVVRRRKRAQ